jgi:hypothetical protein
MIESRSSSRILCAGDIEQRSPNRCDGDPFDLAANFFEEEAVDSMSRERQMARSPVETTRDLNG